MVRCAYLQWQAPNGWNLIFWIGFQRGAILRKRFDIHISGQNVPARLESFEELVSRLVF